MKRTLSLMLTTVLSLGILAGCGAKPDQAYENTKPATPGNQQTAAPVTLKIGQLPIVDGLPFWVAEQKGFFKQTGVNVELVPFKSANERDAAIMSGQIDGMLADMVATSSLVGSGTKVQIASLSLGANMNEGPMAILAAPNADIKELKDLKGVEVATSTNSVMHYVLEKLLLENGFQPGDIKTASIPVIPVRYQALMSGQIKAAILPDPLASLALAQGAKLLASDARAKQNYSHSVIVFSEKAMKEKADGITRMFAAYDLAVIAINQDPAAYKPVMIEKASLPADIKDVNFLIAFSPAQAPKKEDVESVVQWLVDKKILKSKITYEQLVNPSLLPKK